MKKYFQHSAYYASFMLFLGTSLTALKPCKGEAFAHHLDLHARDHSTDQLEKKYKEKQAQRKREKEEKEKARKRTKKKIVEEEESYQLKMRKLAKENILKYLRLLS